MNSHETAAGPNDGARAPRVRMPTFTVWHRDQMDEHEALTVEARNAEDAAVKYAQSNLDDGYCVSTLVVSVRDDAGVLATVRVDAIATFSARIVAASEAA